MPKLRGRKIFRSSKGPGATPAEGAAPGKDVGQPQLLQVAAHSQQFINRTPQRISTISSLMYEADHEEIRANLGQQQQQLPGTYRSAGSLDDDYYAPGHGDRASRPISPIKIPSGNGADASPSGTTLTQRLQRGYKSLSELRLKHIFAKQTTVRRDNIEVDRYVEQYERELKSEKRAQARRDREIAENYDIKVHTLSATRQNTFEDDEVEHEQFEKAKIHNSHETDESGMEATPPLPTRRKPGIAATRFAKVRKPPLEMEEEAREREETPPQPPPRPSSYKQLLNKLPNLPSLPQLSRTKEERPNGQENTPAAKSGLRQNIKRLRKSIKRPAKIKPKQAQADSDEEEAEVEAPPTKSSSGNLRARISRFASTEQLQQRWRKSFKGSSKAATEGAEKAETTTETAPGSTTSGVLGSLLLGSQLEKTLAKLNEKMHQLKFFQRHSANRNPEPTAGPKPNTVGHEPVEIDDDEELAATYHHSDSDEDEDGDGDSGEDISAEEAFGKIQEEEEDNSRRGSSSLSGAAPAHAARQMAKLAEIQAASKSGAAAWSSESLEEIADEDYPRVLIHQEHSDTFESTLIIAVASKGSVSPAVRSSASQTCGYLAYPEVKHFAYPGVKGSNNSSPISGLKRSPGLEIKASGGETHPSAKDSDSPSPEFQTPAAEASPWLPNEQIIAGFKEQTGSSSWPAPALYKPRSIDIFEAAAASGGSSAFADFDEVLRNAPVLRISAGSSCDTSGEEADDSSSRVTRIRVQSPQIGNSRESLMAQEEEDEELEADVEMEMEMEGVLDLELDLERDCSERPPSASPPPPPLPQRRPPPRVPATTAPIYDAVPPPLPVSKPPIPEKGPSTACVKSPPQVNPPLGKEKPPISKEKPPVGRENPPVSQENPPLGKGIPQRSASMSRPAKPLVKTSSLRLTYNEQVRPGDVGKVNKLISRFEGGRPRLCPRRMHSEEYERGREEDEEEEEPEAELEEEPLLELKNFQKRAVDSVTPTNRGVIIPQITVNNNNNERPTEPTEDEIAKSRKKKRESMELALDRQNSNCSRSEYGSPLSFPSSRRSSTPTNLAFNTPNPNPNANITSSYPILNTSANPIQNPVQILQQQRRSRRSMTRDDDNFYSFDSDEGELYNSNRFI